MVILNSSATNRLRSSCFPPDSIDYSQEKNCWENLDSKSYRMWTCMAQCHYPPGLRKGKLSLNIPTDSRQQTITRIFGQHVEFSDLQVRWKWKILPIIACKCCKQPCILSRKSLWDPRKFSQPERVPQQLAIASLRCKLPWRHCKKSHLLANADGALLTSKIMPVATENLFHTHGLLYWNWWCQHVLMSEEGRSFAATLPSRVWSNQISEIFDDVRCQWYIVI